MKKLVMTGVVAATIFMTSTTGYSMSISKDLRDILLQYEMERITTIESQRVEPQLIDFKTTDKEEILVGSKDTLIADADWLAGIPSNLEWDKAAWETYREFNDLEKEHQRLGLSPAEGITNPFHYSKTGDPFGRAAKNWLYENGHIKSSGLGSWEWAGVTKGNETGFAYVDKYGFTHVTYNLINALVYSKDGYIYDYDSTNYRGGYAITENRSINGDYGILFLSTLDGAKPFDNVKHGDETSNKVFKLFNIKNLFNK